MIMKFLFFFLIISFNNTTDRWLSIDDDRVQLIFNSEMESQDLAEIKAKLAEVNISINYVDQSYDDKGKLMKIGFEVDCNDGFSGSATSRKLTRWSRVGFFRDYKSTTSFGTGTFRFKL